MKASECGHIEVVAMLLEAGAPWNAQDHNGYTAGGRSALLGSWLPCFGVSVMSARAQGHSTLADTHAR